MNAPTRLEVTTTAEATGLNGLNAADNALLRQHTSPLIGSNWMILLETISRIALENEVSRLWRRYEQNVGYSDILAQLRAREAYNLCLIAVGAQNRRFPKRSVAA